MGVALVACFALAWLAMAGLGSTENNDVKNALELSSQDPVVQAGHACTGAHEPGFVCPNAKPPVFTPGKEPVLLDKCKGCQSLQQNGGSCPGQYS